MSDTLYPFILYVLALLAGALIATGLWIKPR